MKARVYTWNDAEAKWGPMTLEKAVRMAADAGHAHRYVEVGGRVVFDWDELEAAAKKADAEEQAELEAEGGRGA